MTLTPLHLALGLAAGELTFSMIQQACTQTIPEREDLDWKGALPLTLPAGKDTGRDAQQEELAKDIAAMANSRGGVIIYGIAENGSNAADHIEPVGPPDDTTLQNIRRVASNQIYPPITGLKLTWLTSDGAGGDTKTVLALEIAQSIDAPHLVRPKNQPRGSGYWFAVPFRNGPDTDWMPEKLIETAYRDRLANRRRRNEDLHQLHADLVADTAEQHGGAWIVAVARPDTPRPARPRLPSQVAAEIFMEAWRPHKWPMHLKLGLTDDIFRSTYLQPGLRRFSLAGSRDTRGLDDLTATLRATAEIHFDGSVAVAFTRGGAFGRHDLPDLNALATSDLDQVALDLFTLAREMSQQFNVTGNYQAMLTVEPARGTQFRRPDPAVSGSFHELSEDERIGSYRPVLGPLLLGESADAAIDSLADFAEDAVSQVKSTSRLRSLRP